MKFSNSQIPQKKREFPFNQFFEKISILIFLDAQGIIIVYDVTNKRSFEALNTWLSDVKDKADPNAIICIAGNKMDLKYEQNVTIEDGTVWAEVRKKTKNFFKIFFLIFLQENDLLFLGTSAKSGDGIDGVFGKILDKFEEGNVGFYQTRQRQGTIAINAKDVKKPTQNKKGKSGCAC